MAGEVRRVGVVGLGTMGAGIAQVCAQAGVETIGVEVSEELGERARERAAHYLGRGVEKGRLTAEERDAALDRLTTSLRTGPRRLSSSAWSLSKASCVSQMVFCSLLAWVTV